jgi:hypothetical protein
MRRLAPLLAALGAACASSQAGGLADLRADPPGLGFDCIAPSCTQERPLRLLAEGGVRVYALALEAGTSRDFQVLSAPAVPFDLGAGQTVDVVVRYTPSDAAVDAGAVEVSWGPTEGGDPRTLRVPLVIQTFGTPQIEVSPASVTFGYVPAGRQGTLDVTVRNVGTGNALLEVASAALQGGVAFAVTPAVPPALVLAPRQETRLTLTYRPPAEGVHVDRLVLSTNDGAAPTVEVPVRGTSVEGPRLSVDPGGPVALGDVRVGASKTVAFRLANQGGAPLRVMALSFSGPGAASFQVSPEAAAVPAVAPFESVALTVTFAPTETGEHSASLALGTTDPTQAEMRIELTGRGIDPRLAVSPERVDFGQAVLGWRRGPVNVAARNDGYGPLRIERIFMAPGSSAELELGGVPALPVVLEGGEQVAVELRYVVSSLSTVSGRLVLEGDDAREPRVEVEVAGEGVTCEVGCAMAHATPRCDTGACEIASCESGYYDTDGQVASGCECRIESPEPSSFCAEAVFQGSLVDDDGDSRTVQGQLHHAADVDWYSFFAVDSGGLNELFGDDFDVRITLAGPPGVRMCVFRAQRGAHEDVCPSGVDQPCSGTTSYRDDGSYGSADDADYFIKVFTTEPPTSCGMYTISIRNG